jgi:cell wall-associated NlpC family hydrolase
MAATRQVALGSRARPLALSARARAWMGLVAGGAILLGLAGCQGPRPAGRPSAPGAGPLRPRTPSSPAAWRLEAQRWVGVKYRKGGLDWNGIDCSGLTCRLYREVAGLSLPRTTEEQYRCGRPVSRPQLQPGDLVFFCSPSRRVINHVGLYLGDAQFVHASPAKGVAVSSLRKSYYLSRYYGARRLVL